MTTPERGTGGPVDMNDDVALLVRLAGTSAIAPLDEDRIARVRAAVHGAWRDEYVDRQARQTKTRRRWLMIAAPLAAAASVVIAVAIWRPIRTPASTRATAPVVVAHIDEATVSPAPFTAGSAVTSGSTVTTSVGTLAMTLTTGVHLRLDASSTARVESATDVWLERGAVYVDSAGAHPPEPGASPISIHTPAATVRDTGTQFEVRLAGAGLRIRVRDGQVRVIYKNGADARVVGAGEELFSKPDGSPISRRHIAVTGSEWAWAESAAPPFSMEGKTLGALLDWVSREGAWTVTFADSRTLGNRARKCEIHGRPDLLKGLTTAEVLDVVLPTCGLRYRVDVDPNGGHRVVIERQTSKGAIQ